MNEVDIPEIVIVDRTNDGVVIKFNDGRCAFYSCTYLYSKLSECEQLDESQLDW